MHRPAGKVVPTLTTPHQPAYTVAFTPDGKTLVVAGMGRTATFWDAATGKPLQQLDELGSSYISRGSLRSHRPRCVGPPRVRTSGWAVPFVDETEALPGITGVGSENQQSPSRPIPGRPWCLKVLPGRENAVAGRPRGCPASRDGLIARGPRRFQVALDLHEVPRCFCNTLSAQDASQPVGMVPLYYVVSPGAWQGVWNADNRDGWAGRRTVEAD